MNELYYQRNIFNSRSYIQCSKKSDCGHPLLECYKFGYCQNPWDLTKPCKSNKDCSKGATCKLLPITRQPLPISHKKLGRGIDEHDPLWEWWKKLL